jgi:Ca2+-binding EF-hand superfamily protein
MKTFLLAGAALAAIAAIPAFAQPGPDGPARNAGPLTRAAVQASVQARFAKVDADRDGFVTRAEADARIAEARERRGDRMEQRRGRMEQRRERMTERRAEMRAGIFDRIDADKNGSISRSEFEAHASARAERRAERRGPDGMRGGRGMRHGRMMRHRGPGAMAGGRFGGAMFERMDSDHDGRVSLAEASARALEMFDRADANRDGTVTMEERRAAMQRFREDRRGRQGRRGG